MLRHSNQYLEKCEKLKLGGALFEIKPGAVVARGFADLGYEEFMLLENGKLVSLYRGNLSDFEDANDHFFRVPSAREMRLKIYELEFDIVDLKLTQNIEAFLVSPLGEKDFFSSSSFEQLFLDMLTSILIKDD